MATHGDIGLSQPAASTITMKLRSVTQTLNSTLVHQEVQTIGGAESSLEIARVMATAPTSTEYGLAVRVVSGPSSAADLLARVNQGIGNSSAADRWRVETGNSSAADYRAVRLVDSSGTGYHGPANPVPFALTDSSNAVVKAGDSVNNAVRVNVIASVSTVVTVSTGSVRVHQSSAADLNVTVAGYVAPSTVITIARQIGNSSAADYMPARLVDSSGTGFHGPSNPVPFAVTDSSNAVVKSGDSANNAIRVNVVAGAAGGSTIVTIARQIGNSSAADYMPARLVDSSGTGFHGPANPVPFAVTDSSNAVVKSGDSANNAIRVNVVAGAAGGSTIVTVSTGSVRVHQSTAADLLATVTPSAGSTWPTRPIQSSAADLQMTATPASGSTWRTQPGSTLWASSAGFHFDSSGALTVNFAAAGASTVVTIARQVGNSSAADYMPVRLVDSSGTGYHGPTNPVPFAVTDSSNAVVKSGDSANNAIRVNVVAGAAGGSTNFSISTPISWASLAISTAGQTTNTTVLSSAATTPYVSAFIAASTEAGPIVCAFTAGSTVLWPLLLWAEGGIGNVQQAVPQGGFIFKGQASRPLEFRILSGSTGTIYLGVTYKQE